MAELILKAGTTDTYDDGDVLCAFNRRRIRCVHAEGICHVKHLPGTGLRTVNSLPYKLGLRFRQYRFEQIDSREVRRINQWTSAEDVLSNTPNGAGEYIDLEEYLDHRLKHKRHAIFGTTGSAIWFGGQTDKSSAKVELVWGDIEKDTTFVRTDHDRWPLGSEDHKEFVAVATDEFTDEVAEQLVAPLTKIEGVGDEAEVVIVKKRVKHVDWRNLSQLSVATIAQLADKDTSIDVRDDFTLTLSNVIETKTLASVVG